ncbi:MAG: ethanolamine ammonia-lyase reactivating factor EutA, partial [Actinobacteria bacterium]|nr:ethanolamine ammonia-lyase reactivating factor EutA [Actinomycetota bacterium]
ITMVKHGMRFVPVMRRIAHRSPVLLTPYRGGNAIDVDSLVHFVDAQFRQVGLSQSDVDCGVVILTGTALDRANSRLAADLIASQSGTFVTVSAGDLFEAALAAHGSGAVTESRTCAAGVLNLDIGGGTTKLAVCRDGRIEATAAIDVGARLIVVDQGGVVIRLEPAARDLASRVGLPIAIGGTVSARDFAVLAAYMVDQIWLAARLDGAGTADHALERTAPLPSDTVIGKVIFSGGVAEYLSGLPGEPPAGDAASDNPLGDLGSAIARAIRARLAGEKRFEVAACADGIRSTVLGAAMFTVQLSGDTVHVPRAGVLPLQDVPVIIPAATPCGEARDIARAVDMAWRRHLQPSFQGPLAVAVRWRGSATLERLTATARGLVAGLAALSSWSGPLVLVCDDDVGRLLGRHVQDALPGIDVVSVDGIDLRDLDFIDIAEHLDGTPALPVTVKSLVFGPAAG